MRDIKKAEEKQLRHWKRNDVFKKSVKQREGEDRFVFFEGPPTANGRPGIHHVLTRAFKDVYLRYKTMRGFFTERRAGWDTHGLPVELEVEKELGFSGKADIEKYGIAKFNAKAKKSVWKYKKEWEELDWRIGFWLDHEHPYVTYENSYIESVWWVLKRINEKGLLKEDYKVVPYCPRCGTALASHEIAQGYQTVTDTSATAAFRVKGEENVAILAWTTTPWTLPGNVALAVGADISYAEVFVPEEQMTYVLAKDTVEQVMGERAYEIRGTLPGSKLAGVAYEPLFPMEETTNKNSHKVYVADFVNTEEGTGVVHTAVMYGEDDYRLGESIGLPKVHTVLEDGRFTDFVPDGLSGLFVKDAKTEKRILDTLKKRNLLFEQKAYRHEYPFCWRCSTPLLYYARASWFITMSQLRDELLAGNDATNWIPAHLSEGRFGEWLREVKDWAISRERYWGTPLPIWRCEDNPEHTEVLGSVHEMATRIGFKNRYLLVRHGEAENNVEHILSSDPDAEYPLTKTGRKEAERAAKSVRAEQPDMVLTSDIMRAHQTAGIVGKAVGIEPEVDERLREIKLGSFEGKSLEEYQSHIEVDAATAFSKRPKDGENWSDVRKRMITLVRELEEEHEGKTIVLVAHSGPLLILEMALGGYADNAYFSGELPEIETGQVKELFGGMLPLAQDGSAELHRPLVDEAVLTCPVDGADMYRVLEVTDVWFDSGCMPYAQWHYPFENADMLKNDMYPADYIVEGIDQTRGWFYTLLAAATALGLKRPYRNVISLGHVLDKHGKKMSKSKGNAVDPWELIDRYGADAARWYFFTHNQPWDPKRFDEKDVKTAMNRMLGTFVNTQTFYKTYADRNAFKRLTVGVPQPEKALDRWILSRLQHAVETAGERMDAYDITEAARALEQFVIEELSNWYVRRSRSRFQRPESKDDHKAAGSLLAYVLAETAKALAPFVPFASEEVFRAVTKEPSVHLADFPEPVAELRDETLEEEMRLVQALVAEGLAIRKTNTIAVRQPLAALAVGEDYDGLLANEELKQLILDELNVKDMVRLDIGLHEDWLRAKDAPDSSPRLDGEITTPLRLEGNVRELTRTVQEMRKEAGLKPGDTITLYMEGEGPTAAAFAEEVRDNPDVLRVETLLARKEDKEPTIKRAEREVLFGEEAIMLAIGKT